jgi:acetylornithine deacetylase/succinyl-diaminopimelate desuccinylase-like protein
MHFPDFVNSFKNELKRADLVFFPAFSETVNGRVEIYLGCRGIIYFKIWMKGGDWGGPRSRNIHSSLASFVDSPTWKLINLLSNMRAPNGRILIPGIYDKVRPISKEDQELLKDFVEKFDLEEFKTMNDVHRFFSNEKGLELTKEEFARELFSPCLTIDGITSGYSEEVGSKTVLPCSAFANLDIRLVPDMDTEDTRTKIIDFIQKNAPEAEFDLEMGYKWAKMSPSHPYVKTHIDVMSTPGKEIQIWSMIPGSAPFYIFQDKFDMPFIVGGLGHGSRAHSPNEYAFLESKTGAGGIVDFEISVARLLIKISEVGKVK